MQVAGKLLSKAAALQSHQHHKRQIDELFFPVEGV